MQASPDVLFGSIAVKGGYLTEAQLQRLLDEQALGAHAGKDCTLGDLCLRQGVLSEEQVQLVALAQQYFEVRSEDKRIAALVVQQGLATQAQMTNALDQQKIEYHRDRRLPRRIGQILQDEGLLDAEQVGALLSAPSSIGSSTLHAVRAEILSPPIDSPAQAPAAESAPTPLPRQGPVPACSAPPTVPIGGDLAFPPTTPLAFPSATNLNESATAPKGSLHSPQTDSRAERHPDRRSSVRDTATILPGDHPRPPSGHLMYIYRPNARFRLPSTSPRRTGKVTCPHCWAAFPVEDTLFIARHQELVGDAVLGPGERRRFLPSRFTPLGNAIDAEGMECPDRACPTCHLRLPRCLYERDSFFVSIVGAPGSGKSYYLTALTWELRRLLPKEFNFSFADADPETNQWLNAYEETLFLSPSADRPVYLKKTELQGELYQQVVLNGMPTLLPRPSILTLRPQEGHPRYIRSGESLSRNLVLYDNAGEHFQPGRDTPAEPGTQHLVRSQALFFLVDPTLDPRFQERLRKASAGTTGAHPRTQRQDVLLSETINRILRYRGLGTAGKVDLSIVVIVTKFDAWRGLLNGNPPQSPTRWSDSRNISALDMDAVTTMSLAVRELLLETCPEVPTLAEGFSRSVVYIPVSALGHAPSEGVDGLYYIKPRDIRPWWVTVPFLYLLSQAGFLPVIDRPPQAGGPPTARVELHGDQLRVEVPGSETRYLVPQSHAGHVVRCPRTGTVYRIPALGPI
ncbi:MAG: hypothetical protein HYZ53_28480 [Planctomycetes bacterium]|nr:hypothetical protein [Planctomycetota bacterium]